MPASIILYPPVLNSWMPSFIYNTSPRVYFSISKYNQFEDIKYLQLVCVAQNTNLSVLKKDVYTAGIAMFPASSIGIDPAIQGDDKYYIDIPNTYFTNNVLEINQFYKVQIRFASTEADNWDGNQTTLYTWNNQNLEFLSEWSRVCLLKPISTPSIQLTGFDGDPPTRTYNTNLIDIDGRLVWSDVNEHEVLDHYTVTIKNQAGTAELYKSDIIYVNSEDPNGIYYPIEYLFADDPTHEHTVYYQLIIQFWTENGYISSNIEFNVGIAPATMSGFEEGTNLYIVPYEEESSICIWLTTDENANSPEGQFAFANVQNTLLDLYRLYHNQTITEPDNISQWITIVRASNEDNYTRWIDLHSEYIADYSNINYIYFDYTAEAGVLYKYAVQRRNISKARSTLLYETGLTPPTYGKMIGPEDIFLVSKDDQIALRFDGTVSNYKYNISENASDTIGSQFPFVMRNGNVKYRTFNVAGKINSLVDLERGEIWNSTDGEFYENPYEIKKRQFYGNDWNDYNEYNQKNNIIIQADPIYEKKYRDKVIEFLLNGKPKLFKSTPEGNILIYLMNVSLNNEKSANFIYSFQATAYEIALCNIPNYEKFGIIEKINKFA